MRKEKLIELNNYIEELKTTQMDKINEESKILTTEVYNCKLNNNKTIKREKLLKSNKDGSATIILPFINNDEIILSVEPRVFTKETVGIDLPAGYIELNETVLGAAKRELMEETGYIFEDKNTIDLGSFYQDQGCSSALNKFILAFNCIKKSNQQLDKDEYIKYFICKYEEALELVNLGYIKGANSIIALERSKKYVYERRNKYGI